MMRISRCQCAQPTCIASISIILLAFTVLASPAAQADESIDLDSLTQETREAILEFQQIYSLEAGQVLKRVSPPYPPGRVEVYRRKMERQAKLIPEGPDYFIFRFGGEGKTTFPLRGRLRYSQLGWVGDEGRPVGSLIESFTDISPRNMIGDAELIGTKVAGDWIVRSGSSDEERLTQFAEILRHQCGLPIRFEQAEVKRPVIVVRGEYRYRPLAGNRSDTDEYGDRYDVIALFEHDPSEVKQTITAREFDRFCRFLGDRINRPVINEVDEEPEHMLCLAYHPADLRRAKAHGKVDGVALLAHLHSQTGLRFEIELRSMPVLIVQRTEH